jgi:hypothetical protein
MKIRLIPTFLCAILFCHAQNKPLGGHSTSVTSAQSISSLIHSPCINRKFSVVFYVIQDSLFSLNGSNVPGSYSIAANLNYLNAAFSKICVSFESCKIVIVPDYNFNSWTFGITDSNVVLNWYTPQTINVYIPTNLVVPLHESDGYSAAPPSGGIFRRDMVVIRKCNFQGSPNCGSPVGTGITHLFGHFFGLPNTFDELGPPANPPPSNSSVISNEFADGSNSTVNGDLFDDTEADPYPAGLWQYAVPPTIRPPCDYYHQVKDGKGEFYMPPFDNLMSEYHSCRCRFTQEQYNKMVDVIVTKRLYLH